MKNGLFQWPRRNTWALEQWQKSGRNGTDVIIVKIELIRFGEYWIQQQREIEETMMSSRLYSGDW